MTGIYTLTNPCKYLINKDTGHIDRFLRLGGVGGDIICGGWDDSPSVYKKLKEAQ